MIDFVVGAILVVLVGSAVAYIIRAKKNGVKCIGCPESGGCCSCSHAGAHCGCGSAGDTGCSHTDAGK